MNSRITGETSTFAFFFSLQLVVRRSLTVVARLQSQTVYVVNKLTLGQVFSEYFVVILSVYFYQCSILTYIFILLL